jgi:hypothetical protein
MPSSARTTARRWPRWLVICAWSLMGLLASSLMVLIATLTFGGVHGTEFCPQTFDRRSYSYYELPIVRIQVTGERHEDLTGATEVFLTSKKYITPAASGRQDWHVLVGSRGSKLRQPGDAGLLITYLDAMDSKDEHRWARWSEDHADLAKVFWPAVQELALHDKYIFVPDLFDLAKSISEAAQLKKELDRLVAEKMGGS